MLTLTICFKERQQASAILDGKGVAGKMTRAMSWFYVGNIPITTGTVMFGSIAL